MICVNQLFIYPIKSMKGIAVTQATVSQGGFEYDRILMISEPDGTFITARQFPQLLKIKTLVSDNQVRIILPSGESICIDLNDFSSSQESTTVWGNHFTSRIASIKVNQFFSQYLHKDVQLRWLGRQLSRRTKRYPNAPVSFADGYPYLLLNGASFNYLQQQCPEKLSIDQFRGNIILNGALPFAEDGWKTIKIGDVIFDIVKPCTRCVLTTINVISTNYLANNEPLTTLSCFRADDQGKIDFGMNMIARNHGIISINDPVMILERQPAKFYIKTIRADSTNSEQACSITFEDKTFTGNNKQTILEQLEQQQIALPYSCRSGVCGRCLVVLKKGEVSALTKSAIKDNNQILACSCVPKNNIEIDLLKK